MSAPLQEPLIIFANEMTVSQREKTPEPIALSEVESHVWHYFKDIRDFCLLERNPLPV